MLFLNLFTTLKKITEYRPKIYTFSAQLLLFLYRFHFIAADF